MGVVQTGRKSGGPQSGRPDAELRMNPVDGRTDTKTIYKLKKHEKTFVCNK